MDDLIVIIITLIIVVVGALGQIKKKKPLPQNPEQQNKPPGFWDLLKEEADYPGQQQEYTSNEEPATETDFHEEIPDYQFTVNNEAKSVFMSCEYFEAQLKIGRLGSIINACVSAEILDSHADNTSGVIPPPP